MASLAVAAGAFGAVGDLIPQGCISDVGDPAGCGATAQGLDGTFGVAVSPDGQSVYAVSQVDDAVMRFDRVPGGALAPAGCLSDAGDPAGCGATAQGLDGARGVAVSSDGASVYAVSEGDDAIVRFDRAPGGALAPAGCLSDAGDPAGCGATAKGLASANGVAVSPDGASVYAVSGVDDAIVRFDRAANGALSNPSCIADVGDAAGCGATAQGLNGAFGVAVSPDGQSVYAVSGLDDANVRFDRAGNGALSATGCLSDIGDPAGCGAAAQGLDGAFGVAVSPDGQSVYAVSAGDDAIVRFDRAPGGALAPAGCVSDAGDPAGCGATAQGLEAARGVAVSPDGASVYAVSQLDDAIARFDRAPGGALAPAGCISDAGDPAGCGATAQGLDQTFGVAVSPDGASVYAAGAADDAIVRFDRELAPPAADTDPPETSITKGPKKKTRKRKAKFEFASDEPGSTFLCKLDNEDFVTCDASDRFKVKRRKHKLLVAAVDPAGNTDPTPAQRRWKVKKKK